MAKHVTQHDFRVDLYRLEVRPSLSLKLKVNLSLQLPKAKRVRQARGPSEAELPALPPPTTGLSLLLYTNTCEIQSTHLTNRVLYKPIFSRLTFISPERASSQRVRVRIRVRVRVRARVRLGGQGVAPRLHNLVPSKVCIRFWWRRREGVMMDEMAILIPGGMDGVTMVIITAEMGHIIICPETGHTIICSEMEMEVPTPGVERITQRHLPTWTAQRILLSQPLRRQGRGQGQGQGQGFGPGPHRRHHPRLNHHRLPQQPLSRIWCLRPPREMRA